MELPPLVKLNKENIEWVTTFLRKLDFVKWDRFIRGTNYISIYGWIDRNKDAYKDFVLLVFVFTTKEIIPETSSMEYSEKILKIVDPEATHVDCERAELTFDVVNCIKRK